jgi:hypothetical protein
MIAGTDRLLLTSDVGLFPFPSGGPPPPPLPPPGPPGEPPGAAKATALATNVNPTTDLSVFDVISLSMSYRPLRPRSTTTGDKAEPAKTIGATGSYRSASHRVHCLSLPMNRFVTSQA